MPGLDLAPGHFALAGMAGMVAGATGAVLTAIIMVFEMTWNYSLIVPVMLTASVAYAVRQWLSPPSIYTLKLLRRGDPVPQGLQAWIVGTRRARDVMSKDFTVGATPPPPGTPGLAVVGRDGGISGVFMDGAPVSHVAVEPEDTLVAVLRAMESVDARVALVVVSARAGASLPEVLGFVGDREIALLSRSSARLME